VVIEENKQVNSTLATSTQTGFPIRCRWSDEQENSATKKKGIAEIAIA